MTTYSGERGVAVAIFTETGESWGQAQLYPLAHGLTAGYSGRIGVLRASGVGMFLPWRGNTRVVLQLPSGQRGGARLIAPEGRFNMEGGRWEQAGEVIEMDHQLFGS